MSYNINARVDVLPTKNLQLVIKLSEPYDFLVVLVTELLTPCWDKSKTLQVESSLVLTDMKLLILLVGHAKYSDHFPFQQRNISIVTL